jgi:hypothetical protein
LISLINFINLLCCYIFNIYLPTSARWFLLHSIVNFLVVYYSINDVFICIINYDTCYKIAWNENSENVYNYATLLHIYHFIFFKLTKDDYLHHFLMVCICGSLCYLQKSIISSLALFFLSGLPGAIDYYLLFLVKINTIDTKFEKKVYSYLSAYFRAPGCTYTFAIGMNGIIDYYIKNDYYNMILLLITISLIYWNGQYYFMKSYESYLRKI